VALSGPKVLPTSPACSGLRQRNFTCGGTAAPFIRVFEVTFHSPGSIEFSAAAEIAGTANAQSHTPQNLFNGLNPYLRKRHTGVGRIRFPHRPYIPARTRA
jgi:hypothetical protein